MSAKAVFDADKGRANPTNKKPVRRAIGNTEKLSGGPLRDLVNDADGGAPSVEAPSTAEPVIAAGIPSKSSPLPVLGVCAAIAAVTVIYFATGNQRVSRDEPERASPIATQVQNTPSPTTTPASTLSENVAATVAISAAPASTTLPALVTQPPRAAVANPPKPRPTAHALPATKATTAPPNIFGEL